MNGGTTLGMLGVVYCLALALPGPGIAVQTCEVSSFGSDLKITPVQVMLGILLLISCLQMDIAGSARLIRSRFTWEAAFLGWCSGGAIALLLWLATVTAGLPNEIRLTAVAISLIACMPAASSAPSWTVTFYGNVARCVSVVLVTTAMSPILSLATLSILTAGTTDPIFLLRALGFNCLVTVIPLFLGICLHRLVGERSRRWSRTLRVVNTIVLLLAIYCLSATTLPSLVTDGEGVLLLLFVISVTACMCIASFVLGWVYGRGFPLEERIALMFAIGMRNNGTAILTATLVFGHDSAIVTPMLCYALLQHTFAAVFGSLCASKEFPPYLPVAQEIAVEKRDSLKAL